MKKLVILLAFFLMVGLVGAVSNIQSHPIREINEFNLTGSNITLNTTYDFYVGNLTTIDINITGIATIGTPTATDPYLLFESIGDDGNITWEDVGNTFEFSNGIYVLGANGFINIATKLLVGTYTEITSYLTVGGYFNVTGNFSTWGTSKFNGSLFPITSLMFDIGSGPLRWKNIYATNLSIDNIVASEDITSLGNITGDWGNFDNLNVVNDLFVRGVNLTNLNVTGILNVTGDFTGYSINLSFLLGANGIGGIDLRGDPWYFDGADFEINWDLKVNNTEIENNLVVGGNVTVGGNITAENVFLPAYISAHTNNTIAVASASVWYNVTFDQEVSQFKKRITHNYNDATNYTFIIIDDGIYEITYHLTFEDSQATPLNHIVTRITKNNVELNGFTIEEDTTKQNADIGIHHSDLVDLTAGDEIRLSFTSDATTISLTTHLTYGVHKNTGHITIKRIA